MTSKNILISGGSGLLGSSLTKHLQVSGYNVAVLTRSATREKDGIKFFQWDIKNKQIDQHAIQWADAIIHLAGAGIVDEKWSDARKKEIVDSRVKSSELLINALKDKKGSIPLFISASAIGYYGAFAGIEELTESADGGRDFVADVCKQWEEVLFSADLPNCRKVAVRIGIVLDKAGGALPKMDLPVKLGFGAPLGGGDQYMSWIHVHDLCRIFESAIKNTEIEGPINAVAPYAVTNKDMTKAIARALKRPLWLPNVPRFVLKLLLGARADLVLGGSNVVPQKLLESGFDFHYAYIDEALNQIYDR